MHEYAHDEREAAMDDEHRLDGQRIAFLATDGVEQVELTEPWKAIEQAGGEPVLVSNHDGTIQGVEHDHDGDAFAVDVVVDEASPDDFDALVLPGGVHNPDRLRTNDAAVAFVRGFAESGKPIGAICHGPWLLVEAGLADGHTLTSYPSLRTDIANAGGSWVDRDVVVDDGIITSRRPDDLPAFCGTLLDELEDGIHEELAQATRDD
jgi:protease I